MLNDLETWNLNFISLTRNNSNDIKILSNFINKEVSGFLSLDMISLTHTFTFNKTTFETGLNTLTTYTDAKIPALIIANAWEQAMIISTFEILPGTFILPAPTPPTLFSLINPSILMIDSLILAKQNLINSLSTLKSENDSKAFLKCFRDSFLMIKYTVSGLNSIVPTPIPLLINSGVI